MKKNWPSINLIHENFGLKIGSQNILGPKNFGPKNNFGSNRILDPKKFGQKTLDPKKFQGRWVVS